MNTVAALWKQRVQLFSGVRIGIRANKADPKPFISQAIAECKMELRNVDPYVKAQAVRKLTYLQMMGYDVSWAAFAIVETMSQARFAHKRIGYLAACQCFSESTDVVLLTTNLLKKEFQSTSQYEVGLALNCLANIVTRDLARDLLQDTVLLMSHSKPYVRKKAVSAMYKLYEKYPQGLRLTFEKLKERLNDGEPAVTSCAVNIICELANKNPNNYLSMAPQFFRLLTTSSNNWMLIKVVKLMGSLVPQEPRLARKLLEPLATIIQNTAAKSLQYECIHTLTLALPFTKKADGTESRNVPGIVRLCSDQLRQFIDDPDQNLKYLGLVGFVELMKSHPKAVVEHKELVLLCLSDDDVTIRTRALELLTGMVTRKNLEELVVKLLQHVARAEGAYRDELIARIVDMCSRDKYSFLSDFGWYLSVLVKLAHLRGSRHGALVAEQLIDVAMRVRPVRRYATRDMVVLLLDERLTVGQGIDSIADVLSAAAWITGEYCTSLFEEGAGDEEDDDDDEDEAKPRIPGTRLRERLVDIMTHPRVTNLPASVQNVYLQNALKVVALSCAKDESDDELEATLTLIATRIDVFTQSVHMEVQERSQSLLGLLEALGALEKRIEYAPMAKKKQQDGEDEEDADEEKDTLAALSSHPMYHTYAPVVAKARAAASSLAAIFAEKMVPVNPKAQQRVPVPDGLDLCVPIVPQSVLDELFDGEDLAVDGLVPRGSGGSASSSQNGEDALARVRFVDSGPRFPLTADEDADDELGCDPPESFDERGVETPLPPAQQPLAQPGAARAVPSDDPFYLRETSVDPNEVDVDDVPVVRLTAKDLAQPRKRDKKSKGTKKVRRLQKAEVDTSELMPDGAVESDDDRKTEKKKVSAQAASLDALDLSLTDLAAVDITTPLREDEVMPTIEHRVTSAKTVVKKNEAGLLVNETLAVESPPKPPAPDKKKKKKKNNEPTSAKKKKSSAKAAPTREVVAKMPEQQPQQQYGDLLDLLDFEPQQSSLPHQSSVTSASQQSRMPPEPTDAFDDFCQSLLGGSASVAQQDDNAEDDDPESSLLFARGSLTGRYRVRAKGSACHIEVRYANSSRSDLYSSLSLSVGNTQANVAASLGASASATATLDITDFEGPGATLDGTAAFYVEGLVPQLVQLPVSIRIPAAPFLVAAPLAPSEFAKVLGSQDVIWTSASIKLPIWASEDPVVDVATYLHAHIVERIDDSASMLAALGTDPSAKLAFLVKPIASKAKLRVDIKCTHQRLADVVAAELSDFAKLRKLAATATPAALPTSLL